MKAALLALVLALPLCAQVQFTQSAEKIDIAIDGKPFSTFYIAGEAPKPYLAPLTTADGLVVTRRFPMEKVEGETKDHPHHRGLWFTHGDVNGIDYWMNEKGNKGRHGLVKLDKVAQLKNGKKGVLKASFIWYSDTNEPLLREDRIMTFTGGAARTIDFDVTFTALQDAKFGDTKEGFFAIRLRDELRESRSGSGKMINAEGKSGMKEVWGKASPWVDYSGTLEGKPVGITILEHPKSFRAPTYWHSRDYGLFAANPFGLHDFFNDKTKDGSATVAKGKNVRFLYRVVIHAGGFQEANPAQLFADYSKTKQ